MLAGAIVLAISSSRGPPFVAIERPRRTPSLYAINAEAQTIARLRHPHIVEVHDFGVSEAPTGGVLHWMALEWLEGQTLGAALEDRRARMDPSDALTLLRPVIQAIGCPISFSIVATDLPSEGATMVMAVPGRPARPVRPMR